jgi:hypothetical protein
MSLAEKIAGEINQSNRWTQALNKTKIVSNSEPVLWNALTNTFRSEVARFAALVQAAKSLSFHEDESGFWVNHEAFPKVALRVNRISMGVNAVSQIIRNGNDAPAQGPLVTFSLGVRESGEACFLERDVPLTAEELAEHLLEPIFRVFS